MLSFFRSLLVLVLLSNCAFAGNAAKRAVALTFDDLPLADTEHSSAIEVQDVNRSILNALRRHHAPAIGFVNANKLEAGDREKRTAALEMWLNDGQTLGNHTYSHPDFNKMSVAEFISDAERGESVIRQLLQKHNQKLTYFRYPFNHAGNEAIKKAEFEKWLSAHHYKVATCTVENTDWIFNRAYVRAIASGNKADAEKILSAYLDFTDAKLRFFEKVSLDIAGREFPQVFLAHANRLNADVLDEVLNRMEQRGYKFITLDEAQADPIYRTPDNYVGEYGPMWPYRWAPALKKKIDGRSEPEVPQWVSDAAATHP